MLTQNNHQPLTRCPHVIKFRALWQRLQTASFAGLDAHIQVNVGCSRWIHTWGARHRVYHCLIQTQWPGCFWPPINWNGKVIHLVVENQVFNPMATSNIKLDVAI
jgi:hypothetical protein